MLERLFPQTANNDYRGNRIALWVFVPITVATLVRSGIHIFRADGGAQSIATIPLDTYSEWTCSQCDFYLEVSQMQISSSCLKASLSVCLVFVLYTHLWALTL